MAQTLKEEVRKRIEQAALDTLIEKGMQNCDMRSIAKKAGITPGNLYRYFENKDQLILTLTQPVMDQLDQIILQQTQGELGLTVSCLRLPKMQEGQSLGGYMRSLLEDRIYNVLMQLSQLMHTHPKRMEILLTAPVIKTSLLNWAVQLVQNTVALCIIPKTATQPQINIMIEVFVLSFCEGAQRLLKANACQSGTVYSKMVKAFITMQLSGFSTLLDQELAAGVIAPNTEVLYQ